MNRKVTRGERETGKGLVMLTVTKLTGKYAIVIRVSIRIFEFCFTMRKSAKCAMSNSSVAKPPSTYFDRKLPGISYVYEVSS